MRKFKYQSIRLMAPLLLSVSVFLSPTIFADEQAQRVDACEVALSATLVRTAEHDIANELVFQNILSELHDMAAVAYFVVANSQESLERYRQFYRFALSVISYQTLALKSIDNLQYQASFDQLLTSIFSILPPAPSSNEPSLWADKEQLLKEIQSVVTGLSQRSSLVDVSIDIKRSITHVWDVGRWQAYVIILDSVLNNLHFNKADLSAGFKSLPVLITVRNELVNLQRALNAPDAKMGLQLRSLIATTIDTIIWRPATGLMAAIHNVENPISLLRAQLATGFDKPLEMNEINYATNIMQVCSQLRSEIIDGLLPLLRLRGEQNFSFAHLTESEQKKYLQLFVLPPEVLMHIHQQIQVVSGNTTKH